MEPSVAAHAQAPPDIDRSRLSDPARRAFLRIADLWGLSVDQRMILLGVTSRSTFFKWQKSGSALPKDTLERISCVLGIHRALQVLLPDETAADAWVKRPNAAFPFGEASALDRMLSGQVADLYLVRQYLDAQTGGGA